MKKNTRYILDINGVIQEYAANQAKRFGFFLMFRLKLTPWGFARIMSDIKRNGENASQTAQKFVEMYYEADQHIKTPFLPGAVNTVKNLLKNHPVHICSANKYSCKSDKKYADYLTKEIGNFEEIYFVKPSESKSGYYESVKERFPDDEIIVIEDSGRHINDAESIGLKTLKCDRKIGIAGLKSFAP